MKVRIFLWSIASALAGFLFGFDTVVISGAEQTIQKLWNLTALTHGLAMGSALYGTVIGSLLGGFPADIFGRRKTLIFVGILYIVSALGCALANNIWVFTVSRFIGGLGIGISTVSAPLYISEISPPRYRGRLAGLFQFNIVFGIVIAFLSNAVIARLVSNDAWRWMLGVAAFPSVIYTALCFLLPESPRWLIVRKRNKEEGLKVLQMIDPESPQDKLNALADEIEYSARSSSGDGRFWTWKLRYPIALAILIAFFNQLSGINAVLYFAPRIFEMTGLARESALLQSVGIGVTNLIFTFVGLWMIDRFGRRTLLYIGSVGYIVSLALTAWAFFTQHFSIVPVCIFAFIASHAIGQGTVIWVFISEIFPNRYRAKGQSLGSSTHWIFAALITTIFPKVVTSFAPGYVFLFFSFMMCLQLIWVKLMVPETKGVSLEELQKKLGIESV
ncbi:MAG: sugar porter family MFS transporter [Verrucomicrobiia bacterium]